MTVVTKVITCFSKVAERAQRGRREGAERAQGGRREGAERAQRANCGHI